MTRRGILGSLFAALFGRTVVGSQPLQPDEVFTMPIDIVPVALEAPGPPMCPRCHLYAMFERWPDGAEFVEGHRLTICTCGWTGVYPRYVGAPAMRTVPDLVAARVAVDARWKAEHEKRLAEYRAIGQTFPDFMVPR